MSNIIVNGAREGNLNNISLEIPRNKLIVFTGLSGSGKSTLAVDVIFQECQRQYLEAMGMQGINKPDIDSIRNVSPAIMITQSEANKNPRSTVGTLTDIYTDLRMVYEKLSVRICPSCKETISAADCREEFVKAEGNYRVFMYCNHCGHRMDKLTRTHFSYNTKEGACKTCEGLGKVLSLKKEKVVNEALSLEEGAVYFWDARYKEYQISSLYNAFRHYQRSIPEDVPVEMFDEVQKAILYDGVESQTVKKEYPELQPPKTVAGGKFEGICQTLTRRMAEKGGEGKSVDIYFEDQICPECKGDRLDHLSGSVTVNNTRLPELSKLSLEELCRWISELENSIKEAGRALVHYYIVDLKTKLQRIINVGLGYLSLERQTITLSGGELQRVKLAATLDSDLTGIIYIMDEPTVGLHSKDTEGMITILKKLRDLGNTVIVIEHDTDVMEAADYIVDIGPGSGKQGGNIVGIGTLEELKAQRNSVTGQYLLRQRNLKNEIRSGSGELIQVKKANLYNLKNIDVSFPTGCLTVVTGVSGSGKSTLIFEVLTGKAQPKNALNNIVIGMEHFDQVITIEQASITRTKRSNVATYSEVYTEIRKIFSNRKTAKERGLTAKHFSFNTPGGRCENCEGLGYVSSNMLFFKDIEVTCPVCGGNRFHEEVLSINYKGYSIQEVLKMSVEEALEVFSEVPAITQILTLLKEVGLGYLELGQTLTTLSGGEGQRLKLAKELINSTARRSLYLMDEPTTGLHPVDVDNFLLLLDRLVDSGNTVILVEHNQQVMQAADWIIDLGPEGGIQGGEIVYAGTPRDMIKNSESISAQCLRKVSKDKLD